MQSNACVCVPRLENVHTGQSIDLLGNSTLNLSQEMRRMTQSDEMRRITPNDEMRHQQSIGHASFLRIPLIYIGNRILRIICLIPTLLGIIGGINAIMEFLDEPDVIVHLVHLSRQRGWLSDLFQ